MLGYLISPVLQVENVDGKPLVGGRISVYRHGTTEPYITYKDFEGNRNPAEVILDAKGMAILIAEEGYSYDVYCRDRNYVEQWSRIGISIGLGGTSIISKDGTITVKSAGGVVDLGVSDNEASVLTGSGSIRTSDGSYAVTKTASSGAGLGMSGSTVEVLKAGWYHVEGTWHATPTTTKNEYRTLTLSVTNTTTKMALDLSTTNEQWRIIANDYYFHEHDLIDFVVAGLGNDGAVNSWIENVSIHRLTNIVGNPPDRVRPDWAEQDPDSPSYIFNKPVLATVATTGEYSDLLNKPDLNVYMEKEPAAISGNIAMFGSGGQVIDSEVVVENLVHDADYVHTDENFTSAEKSKLAGIQAGAEVNVQANWTEMDSSSDSYIKNKPNLATVATTGEYSDLLNKPVIPTVSGDGTSISTIDGLPISAASATTATRATQDGSGNDIVATYGTKAEVSAKQDQLTPGVNISIVNGVIDARNNSCVAGGAASFAIGFGTNSYGNYSLSNGYHNSANIYAHAEGYETHASGQNSHTEGYNTKTYANGAHAEGFSTSARGAYSHSEGISTRAMGQYSHAEGNQTVANGEASHAEGNQTSAMGSWSHAAGRLSFAQANHSHANGDCASAVGIYSHALGKETYAGGQYSFAIGNYARASGDESFAIGTLTRAVDSDTHAEGVSTSAFGRGAHSEGHGTLASATYAHAEGESTSSFGINSHAEGETTIANARGAHAEGENTVAGGQGSHAEGYATSATGVRSHAEGNATLASTNYAHAEGYATSARGTYSHTAGDRTQAPGSMAHAEGYQTIASGEGSHTEGYATSAIGNRAHAEGYMTIASGNQSHAEGWGCSANVQRSHAEGLNTVTDTQYQHVEGQYNAPATGALHVVGNGASLAERSNIVETYTDRVNVNGDLIASGVNIIYKTKKIQDSFDFLSNGGNPVVSAHSIVMRPVDENDASFTVSLNPDISAGAPSASFFNENYFFDVSDNIGNDSQRTLTNISANKPFIIKDFNISGTCSNIFTNCKTNYSIENWGHFGTRGRANYCCFKSSNLVSIPSSWEGYDAWPGAMHLASEQFAYTKISAIPTDYSNIPILSGEAKSVYQMFLWCSELRSDVVPFMDWVLSAINNGTSVYIGQCFKECTNIPNYSTLSADSTYSGFFQ